MDTKQLEISCPCCSTRILVDVRTAKVLRTRKPGEQDDEGKPKVGEADWSEALGRVRRRTDEGPSKLDAALEQERGKSARLDDLFREASKKAQDGDEE